MDVLKACIKLIDASFHSINVPSEWGPGGIDDDWTIKEYVSIQLMSPASGDMQSITFRHTIKNVSFHSINVPSEWGLHEDDLKQLKELSVSIQLMSPASGDPSILNPYPVKCPETVSEGQEKKW